MHTAGCLYVVSVFTGAVGYKACMPHEYEAVCYAVGWCAHTDASKTHHVEVGPCVSHAWVWGYLLC